MKDKVRDARVAGPPRAVGHDIANLPPAFDPKTLGRVIGSLSLYPTSPSVPKVAQIRLLHTNGDGHCTCGIILDAGDECRRLIGKAYATDRPDIYQVMERLWRTGFGRDAEFAVPQPVAYVPSSRLLLQEWVEGTPAKKVFKHGNEAQRAVAAERCARWLARYQAVAPQAGPVYGVGTFLGESEQKCRLISETDGSLGGRCEELIEQLRAAAPSPRVSPMCASHGDYSDLQVIFAGERTVVVDWDDYGVADPTRDVAHFIVSLERLAGRHLGSVRALDGAAEAFLKAYLVSSCQPHVAARLPFYKAAHWLRGRDDALEIKPPGWREWVEVMLDEASRALGLEAEETASTRRWPTRREMALPAVRRRRI